MRNYRKKCLSISVICFLISILLVSTAFAGAFSFRDEFITARGPVASGKVTQANMRLSLVNGTAFVDFSAANVLTDHVGKYLRVTDAAGKSAWGYIKAAGTGETLGDEQLTNVIFDNTDSWAPSVSTLASIAGGQAGNCLEITQTGGSAGYGLQNLASFPANSLFKFTGYHKNGTAKGRLLLQGGTGYETIIASISQNDADWTAVTQYGTALTVNGVRVALGGNGAAGQATLWDTVSLKQVLTPSATGVTITSTAGGSTYNWTSIESGFDYNASAGYSWAIYDDATQVLNGSAAEPGVGTRTVTDTENKLSIANGALTFSGGKASLLEIDPMIKFPSITRAAGRGLFAKIGSYTSGRINNIYLSTDGSQSGTKVGFRWVSPTLYHAISGATNVAISDTAPQANDVWAIFMRATGNFTFVNNRLVWISASDATATLYPAINNYDGVFSVDAMRVPSTLWLPSPLVSDGFSAWGTSDGAGHAESTGLGSGGSGKTWIGTTWSVSAGKALNTPTLGEELATGTLTVGTWYSITATEANHFYTGCAVGNTFRAGATTALDANNKVKAITLSELISVVETSTRDVLVTASIASTPAGTQAGVCVGVNSATSPTYGVFAYHDGINAKLDKIVNGVWTSVISAAATWSNNAELRVIRDGTSFRLYYDNAQIGATSTISDVGDYTLHGLFSTYSGNQMDNFTVYPRGSNGEYSNLNAMMAPPGSGGGFGIGYMMK